MLGLKGVSVSEYLWKWQHKLRNLGTKNEKTVADFELKQGKQLKVGLSVASSKIANIGSTPSIKTFYEGPMSQPNAFNWVDYPPRQLSKSAVQANERVAIRVYKIKDTKKDMISGYHTLKYHQIEVQSPLLLAALADVLKDQDVHIDVNDTATFHYPFIPLYFAYDGLVAKRTSLTKDDPLDEFLLLLIRLLDDIFAPIRTKLKNLRADRLVSFELAWAYFPRDTVVLSWGKTCERLCKVVDTSYTKGNEVMNPILIIRSKVLIFNGEAFSWEDATFEIPQFSGHKPITKLDHYPLEFSDDADGIKKKLTARGRKVLDYQGITYCAYSGIAIHKSSVCVERLKVNGRILIDVVGYNKHHRGLTPRETMDLDAKTKVNVTNSKDRDLARTQDAVNPAVWKWLDEDAQARNKTTMLEKQEDLMFMSPLLEGYTLTEKVWCCFFVDDIEPMVWNDKAYDHLVYDEEQKDLVLSFVESHGHVRHQVDDVIMGKGLGLIVLLSGPPGTGKTLTAEAIADRTRRPLFYLQAEDLGVSATTLATQLKKILEMATDWGAVILLDEADVFMAERHPQDIARNELVSIFLRELEYYRGIIFLTTNLYSTVDSAFRSRISLHLLFQPLTSEARNIVWRKFLNRLPEVPQLPTPEREMGVAGIGVVEDGWKEEEERKVGDGDRDAQDTGLAGLSDEDINELAAWQLNGREIKTAVKMAKTWCDYKGHEMTLSRLENGIKATTPHAAKVTHEGDVTLYDD